jgi:SAM-dependent methyltransferase
LSNFDLYSEYYDLLYRDKDYDGEVAYLTALAKKQHPSAATLLDLGCGTGKHAALLQQNGYQVGGVDLSATMLAKAQKNYPAIPFHHGDARTVRLRQKFDVVTSLFHVASYQTSNKDFSDFLATAKAHLAPGGIFIFDFWFGPGVANDPPAVRVKRLENERVKILRVAEPAIQIARNVVNVTYQVFVTWQDSGKVQEIVENHEMRYFFEPELRYFLEQSGLELREIRKWMSDSPPDLHSWNACIVASHR